MSGERAYAQLMEYVYAAGARWRCVVGIRSRTGATVCWAFELRVRGVVHTRVGDTWDVALSSAVRHIPQSTVRRSPLRSWRALRFARATNAWSAAREGGFVYALSTTYVTRRTHWDHWPKKIAATGRRPCRWGLGLGGPVRLRRSGARRPRTGPAGGKPARAIALRSLSPLLSRAEVKARASLIVALPLGLHSGTSSS